MDVNSDKTFWFVLELSRRVSRVWHNVLTCVRKAQEDPVLNCLADLVHHTAKDLAQRVEDLLDDATLWEMVRVKTDHASQDLQSS